MNIILLSGGSGKRLWPLSNDVRSKQFLKIFKREDGTRESMVQRMYRMIKSVDDTASVVIATGDNQVPQIRAQLGDAVGISIEPARRDTFPAIVLACAYLRSNGAEESEPVVICPVDPHVNEDYFAQLKTMADHTDNANLTLMGIEPTYPSENYGYIIPEDTKTISSVKEFKEKPDVKTATEYIKNGALWNSGVFAFKLRYILNKAEEVFGTDKYEELLGKYETLQKISFDYAVAEKESDINVIRFKGEWKDLGTWDTFSGAMSESTSGNVTADYCENTHIVNELGIPLIALGEDNSIIAATPDGILVAEKSKAHLLKDYVASARPMYERRAWGEYKVLDYKVHADGNNSLVKELIISEGQHISYQKHEHRTEIWTFTEGEGDLIIDGKVKRVKRGDVAVITPQTKHAIKGITELHIIEVQIGDELTEEDIIRLDWEW